MIDRLLLKCCVEDSTCYFGNCFHLVVRDVYSVYSEAVSGQVSTRDMYTRIADPVSFIHDVRNSGGFVIYLHTTSCSWLYLGFNHMPTVTVQPARQDSNNERYKSCDQRSVVILLATSSDKGNKHSSKPVVCLTFSCCCSGVLCIR